MGASMSFGAPLGLLALLAAPLLVGLYFLRRRQPPRVVSALFLWASPDQRAEAGPKLQRFSREASLALELGACLAATAFLADLRCGGKGAERHTVVVLDGSLSMSARTAKGRSVADEALAALRKLADEDAGVVTVIESGLRARIVEGPASPPARLASLRYAPRGPAHDFAPALSLARELAGPRSRIRLITDKPIDPAPEGVEVVAVGEALENDAFVAAARVDRQGKAIVALRVAHFGRAPVALPVALTAEDGTALAAERLALGPGEEKAVRFEVAAPGPVLATLPDDALAADGRLRLLPQPVRALAVAVKLPEGPEAEGLRRFLKVDGAANESEPADLVFAPPGEPSPAPWTVTLGTKGETRALVGPFFADRRHPLLDAVPLEGLLWAAGESAPGTPLLTAGDLTLIGQESGPVLRLNVDLARSNLARSPAWPVLLSNLLSMRREAMPGFPRHDVALDEEIAANVEPGARWALSGPSGEQPLRGAGTLRLGAPGVPGTYRLLKDGKPQDELEVLPIDRRESDLSERAAGRQGSPLPVGRIAGDRARSAVPLLLLALLLCLDWMVTGRAARRP